MTIKPAVHQRSELQLAPAVAPGAWWLALVFVALAATVVISPLFFLGNPSGHDIQFHLSSWIEVARQWRHGILFPRWAEWANWGFGEPRFIFYPPISWMLGAMLGSILPWNAAPGAMIWILLVVAGMSMWVLAREWLSHPASIAAAVFFAADPYHLVILYYRSDFAELLGAALFPLLFWGAVHVARGEKRYVPVLAVVFAAIWLCNAPAGVIGGYSLVLALGISCIASRSLRPALWGGLAIASGFALAAFYLFPAFYEQRWVQIANAVGDFLRPDRNFLFARNNELGFVQFNTRVSRVAVGMIVAAAAAWIAFMRRRRFVGELWWMLSAVGVLAIVLMISPSLFLWHLLPKLWFIQFPWRWLGVLAVPLAFFVAAVADSFRRRCAFSVVVAAAAAGIIIAATLIVQDTWWDSKDASYIMRGIQAGHGYEGTDEYAPLGVSHWDLPGAPQTDDKNLPPAPEIPRIEQWNENSGEIVPVTGISVHYHDWSAERRIFSVTAAARASLVLRLVNYPAWDVRLDGVRIEPGYVPLTGQMIVPITAGNHRIDIRFRRTWDRTLGSIVSLAAALMLLLFATFALTKLSGPLGSGVSRDQPSIRAGPRQAR